MLTVSVAMSRRFCLKWRTEWNTRRPILRVALRFTVLLSFLYLLLHSFYLDDEHGSVEVSSDVCSEYTMPGRDHSGFTKMPVESTVLMLYTPRSASKFCFSDGMTEDDVGCTTSSAAVERDFLHVSASYLASPYESGPNPYYDFFDAHNATLWTLDASTRVATPMQIDIVYTYVNPAAPSFKRHLAARGVPFEQRRYRDWEELRYSLRSLRAFALQSGALAQYHRSHTEDVLRLSELGYSVNSTACDGVESLVRRVYLVLSDKDQVPHWLDVQQFPQLRVVTHAEMFDAEEAKWILPTLNSNVIESGLHRIPGISPFFLYTANDMFIGRKMSFFDLFRPLSPFRQLLHFDNMLRDRGGLGSEFLKGCEGRRRNALLFEPVVHSETDAEELANGPNGGSEKVMKAQRKLSACLYRSSVEALDAQPLYTGLPGAVNPLPGWASTKAFAMSGPNCSTVAPGQGVTHRYFNFISSLYIHGLGVPFGYAHIPHLIHREVYAMQNEVELFDITNVTRGAFEREMHAFSPIDIYAAFATAVARGVERRLWVSMLEEGKGSVFVNTSAMLKEWWVRNVLGSEPRLRRSLRRKAMRTANMEDFGPLYGDTWRAQLQHPNLPLEMGYWWLRGASSISTSARSLESLQSMYPIPSVALGDSCDSTSPQWIVQDDDNYYRLLHDMHHHPMRDNTYLFEMIQSSVKALLVAAKFDKKPSTLPLFIALNDNFPSNVNITEARVVFRVLLRVISQWQPAAPWERN